MVTMVLGTGMTTLAFFQKASSVGWASGSARIPRRISAGVIRRSLSQSVPLVPLRKTPSGFDVLPVRPSLARLRAPRRDDAPLVILFSVGINYCYFQPTNQSDCIDSILTVVKSIIRDFDGRTFENPDRIFESNSTQLTVAAVLSFVPSVSHIVYLHNVNISSRKQLYYGPRVNRLASALSVWPAFLSRVGTTVFE